MSMQHRINKSYFLSRSFTIFILLKFYIDFLQTLRKIEKVYNFDLDGKRVVLDDEEKEKPNSPANNPSIYSNVFLHSGEFIHSDVDLHIPGRGFDFVFNRTYRSQSIYSGVLGWGWDHNYNKRLLEMYGGDIIYYDGTGRRERYEAKKDGNGNIVKFNSPAGWFTQLKKMQDGTFRHIYPHRTIEFFDAFGRLIKIQDRNQNKMEFYYNLSGQLAAIMDTMGRVIEFEYYDFELETDDQGVEDARVKVTSGRLEKITDFRGRTVEFTYDINDKKNGDLIKVEFGDDVKKRVKKYEYSPGNEKLELAHNLEKIYDPKGYTLNSPVLTVLYTNDDKVEKQRFADMDTDILFSIGETSTTVTDARGNPKIFISTDDNQRQVSIGDFTTKYDLNDDGLITNIEYPEGNIVSYNYYPAAEEKRRSAGNLVSVVSTGSDGSITTTYKYETYWNQVEKIIDPKGNETKITHDGNGNIDTVTLPGIEQPYDYEYYPPGEPRICGVLKSITDPMGSVTEYTYYPESSPSGDGMQPVFGRNTNSTIGGYLQSIVIDKNGDRISQNFQYDQLGNITKKTDGEGVLTTYGYNNPFGEVSTLIQGASQSEDGQPQINLLTTFDYDENGNLKEQKSKGITTEYEYDRLNRLRFKRYKGGSGEGEIVQEYEYKYDNSSNLKEIIYPRGNKDIYTYDHRDLIQGKSSGNGLTTESYTYTPNGYIHTFTDGENKVYTYVHDSHGRLKDIIDPSGNKVSYGYDENSNLTTLDASNSNGPSLNLSYVYDPLNRLTHQKIQKESGFINTQYGYNDTAGYLEKIITPNNHQWGITPTGSGSIKSVTDPIGNIDTHTYDKRGWLKAITETESGPTGKELVHNVTNNVVGNPILTGDSVGRDYKYFYNHQKQVIDVIQDPENGIVTYEYDGLNRLYKEIRHITYNDEIPKESSTTYFYDANNNLEKIRDNDGNETVYTYDSKDRLTDIQYPGEENTIHVTYNGNDQIKTYTDLNGTLITNTYWDNGLLKERTIIKGEGVEGPDYENFEYDGPGRLTKASNNDSEVEFIYNRAGRLEKEIQKIKDDEGEIVAVYEVVSEYDDNGNVTKLTYPSGKEIIITPDALDRIDTIVDSAGKQVADYEYEGRSKVKEKKLSNNAVTMKVEEFDAGRRPLDLTYQAGNSNNILFGKGMTWNLLDMKKTETELNINKEFKYDTALRLREETNKGEDNFLFNSYKFEIDTTENLKKIGAFDAGSLTQALKCETNHKHQVTSVDYIKREGNNDITIHVEPGYDKNGNMTGFVHQYFYNYKNQLVKVITGTGVVVEYKYDVLGRRVEKRVTDPDGEDITRYVHDRWRVIEERDDNDNLKARYTYGNGIDERVELELKDTNNGTLTPYIPMHDIIGNVIGIADGTGKLIEKYIYSTYGVPVFEYDIEKPKIESVTTIDGLILMNFSEPVDQDKAKDAVSIKMGGLEISGAFSFSEDGRTEIFTPSGTLPHGELTVEISTVLEDKAGNKLANIVSQNFNYQGADIVAYDSTPPEVERIDKISNDFIVKYTETINPETIERSIEIKKADGTISGTITSINPSTYKFTPEEMLEIGKEYEMRVSAVRDLSGKEINEFFHKFVVMNDDMLVYEKVDPNQHSTSNVGNNYLFHGRTFEPEVGLYFYRHRYYLPRIGRFLQTDPMGYEDSMNLYQAFNQNPVNFVDPYGNVTAIKSGKGPIRTVNLEIGNIFLDYTLLNFINTLLNALGFTINTGLNTSEYALDKLWDASDWLFAESGISNRGEWVDMRPVVEPYFVANPTTISNSTRHLLNRVDDISYRMITLLKSKGHKIINVRKSNERTVILSSGEDAIGADEMADILGTGPTSKKGYGVYPVETPRGIRWRMEGKKGFVKSPDKGKVVFGSYDDYIKVADRESAAYFNIPKSVYKKMSKKEIWRKNVIFIDDALKRGDKIIFSNLPIGKYKYFTREIWNLRNKGVDISKIPIIKK